MIMRSAFVTSLAGILAAHTVFCAQVQPPAAPGQRLRLVPQNEAARAPNFPPVAARFETAVRTRNVNALLDMVSDEIRVSESGDERGPAAFRLYWKLDDPASGFWTTVEELLAGGSAFWGDCNNPEVGCYVTYPYWSERFPDDTLDRLYYLVVRRDNAPVYAQPRDEAAVVDRLSYEVVRRSYDSTVAGSDTWTEIARLDGPRGFMRTTDTYNPTFGFKMIFRWLNKGPWELAEFTAGD